jgi:hypothetical protein
MSILIMLASVFSDRVEWRGTEMHADHAELPTNDDPIARPRAAAHLNSGT